MTHKPIPPEFTKGQFQFRQIERTGDLAIFEKSHRYHGAKSFEVVKITRHDSYTLAGNFIEPAETYPSSERWGAAAFTLTNEKDAWKRLAEMREGAL